MKQKKKSTSSDGSHLDNCSLPSVAGSHSIEPSEIKLVSSDEPKVIQAITDTKSSKVASMDNVSANLGDTTSTSLGSPMNVNGDSKHKLSNSFANSNTSAVRANNSSAHKDSNLRGRKMSNATSSNTNNNTNSKKRNTASLSTSLRRLFSITFTRDRQPHLNSNTKDFQPKSTKSKLLNASPNISTESTTQIIDSINSDKQIDGSTYDIDSSRLSNNVATTSSDYDKFSSLSATLDSTNPGIIKSPRMIECPLCVLQVSDRSAPYLAGCRHRVCLECMQRYIKNEINHSRLNITCPICTESIHPNSIRSILNDEKYYLKYESFMLRRVLAAEPDARWCPAPDCGYVVIASGCASCPKLVCGRDDCNTSFCYHCKQEWHANQTCNAARIQRNLKLNSSDTASANKDDKLSQHNRASQQTPTRTDDIKECPVCTSRIIKMNDGSCNHMTCSICETEFCWLCMKEITDLHYFSPSGCTFWGKKPWSRKKKILWQLGLLAGAPICIVLMAGIAVPAIIIGIPVWAGRKLYSRLAREPMSRRKKHAIIGGGVLLSMVVSPLISAVALFFGVPILLGYVYGVVPVSLCRSGGCGLSSTESIENLQHELQNNMGQNRAKDGISIDTALSQKLGDPSIGETSLYLSNVSLETNSIGHVTTVEREDRESASNAALAGSIISKFDDGNSTRALAGSIISKESGDTVVPVEVHATSSSAITTTTTITKTPASK